MDRQMKGEYFKMKNHGLRRIFSLFLALFMVFTLLPTTALAEDTTGADETQPKTVVVNEGEKKTDPPAQEQPKNENPPAPEEPKTFTVTYTDGADGAVFPNQVSNLPAGTATPAFSGTLARDGYTFAGWNPAVAETVTANVTYVAQWEAGKTNPRRVTVPPIPDPGVAPAALNTGHKIDVRFTVLYVGDEFNIGYNYGSSEKTQFVCQYKTNHSDTASTNHTIAISDIKAAAGRASVNSGYQIVGWSKESNANPTTWSLNKSGTTACNKGTTIYLVAKNPNPTTKYTYTLNYDANGGTGAPSADSWSTTDAAIRYHSFTVKNTIPTREGYVFKGWKANDGSDTIYTGGTLCSVSQYGNDVVKNGNTWTRTLYAVWEEDAPGEGDLENIEKLVRIVCDRNIHDAKEYGVIAGSCEFGDIDMTGDVPTCPVTIQAAEYVKAYNGTIGVEHTITGDTERLLILAWDANNNVWRPMTDTPVTFTVICPPAKPGAEDLAKLEAPVEVVCTTKPETHTAAPFSLIEGTYNIGDVSGNETDGYTCDIIITADEYVTKYNTDFGKHTLTGDNTKKTLTLKYVEGKWVAEKPVTFPVKCETEPETTYTVTYTDGVDGEEVFADQVYTAKYEDATPAFEGTPARAGYKFLGWEPTVAETVTENATYVAQWEKLYTVTYTDGVGGKAFEDDVHSDLEKDTKTPAYKDGIPTRKGFKFLGWEPEVAETVTKDVTYTAKWEKLYTVTYTDGAKGKAFEDQVYSDLESGTDTPKFDGKPTRKGYTFTDWSPKVTDTVTKDVTYVAQWKSVKNGKDNIPKTGDSEIVMVLGSVLLFSFCGAAAVSVYDRKRKHF